MISVLVVFNSRIEVMVSDQLVRGFDKEIYRGKLPGRGGSNLGAGI